MSVGNLTSKKVRWDTPPKSGTQLGVDGMKDRRSKAPVADFDRFLSDYFATGDSNVDGQPRLSRLEVVAPQGAFNSRPKPICELELSVYDSTKKVMPVKQQLFPLSKMDYGEGIDHSQDPPLPPRRMFKQPEYPLNRHKAPPPPSTRLHYSRNCCVNNNFKSKCRPPHNNCMNSKQNEIDDHGFFLRPQNTYDKSSKHRLNKNEFKQIMKPQFLQKSNSSETIEPIHNINEPEYRFTNKSPKNIINSDLDQSIPMPKHKPVNCDFIPAGSIPAMLPVFSENLSIWPTGNRLPEISPQYLIGCTSDGRGVIYPWKANILTESTTQPCGDNGVNAKIKAIISHNQVLGDRSQEEVAVQTLAEAKVSSEPTVNDLLEILKQQGEQLEKLYNKVDMLLEGNGVNCHHTVNNCSPGKLTKKEINVHESDGILEVVESQSAVSTEECRVKSTDVNVIKEQLHQMSIGVMTSFEMVMTSTRQFTEPKVVLPRKNVRKTEVAIQSTIESETSDDVLQHLDPCKDKIMYARRSPFKQRSNIDSILCNVSALSRKSYESSSNEKSFGNVILNMDKFPSRQTSPEPSLRLEMKDFSGLGSTELSQSERGWTYFNKAVNNVDEILNRPPIGALTRMDYVEKEMIQKHVATLKKDAILGSSNISMCLSRRVKFGGESAVPPMESAGMYTHKQPKPITDTSIQINQLAKKYLKDHPVYNRLEGNYRSPAADRAGMHRRKVHEVSADDFSFGTIHGKSQYFEKHHFVIANKDLCDNNGPDLYKQQRELHHIQPDNILDIQALKRQPKFL